MTEVSPVVLRNKGVPVIVQRLSEGGDLLFDSHELPMTEERYVRFTVNVMSQLETIFQGKEVIAPDGSKMIAFGPTAWQDFLRTTPVSTTRGILALMWNMKVEDAGAIMLADQMAQYAGALVSAYAIAEGVDPLVATAAIRQRIDEAVAEGQNNFHQATMESPTSSS